MNIIPPQEILITLPVAPVSLQAKSAAKHALKEKLQAITKPLHYLLCDDVAIEIEWRIHERVRYETDYSPDVDNIIKPLLDGLCGPNGILIDDNQVRSISTSWHGWTKQDQEISIRIKYETDAYIPKGNLVFIETENSMCFPLQGGLKAKTYWLLIDNLEKRLAKRNHLRQSHTYEAGQSVMPIQRLFHKSRVQGFPISTLAEFKRKLSTEHLKTPLTSSVHPS